MVQERQFRADLYYRLNVFPITLPPLRERAGDIPLLTEHFVQTFSKRQRKSIEQIPDEAIEVLKGHDWPGNIRELKNVVERAVVLAQGDMLDIEDLNLSTLRLPSDSGEITLQATAAYQPSTLDDIEKNHILATLQATKWNKSRTAELLGIERTTLDRKIKRYNLIQP